MYGPVRSHQSDLLEPLRYSSSFESNIYSIYNTESWRHIKGYNLNCTSEIRIKHKGSCKNFSIFFSFLCAAYSYPPGSYESTGTKIFKKFDQNEILSEPF